MFCVELVIVYLLIYVFVYHSFFDLRTGTLYPSVCTGDSKVPVTAKYLTATLFGASPGAHAKGE